MNAALRKHSLALPFAQRGIAFFSTLLLLLPIGLAPVWLAGCEDEVAPAAPPQKAEPAKRSGGRKRRGPAPVESLVESGAIAPEGDVAIVEIAVEEPPDPDPDSVWAYLHVTSPIQALRVFSTVSNQRLTAADAAAMLGAHFGIEGIEAVEWAKPALVGWVGDTKAPFLAVSIVSRDEFLTPLPRDSVTDRQGNEFNYVISMRQTMYVNFLGDVAVMTSDWRHFPLARERIAEIIAVQPKGLLEGELKLDRYPDLNRRIAGLAAPHPALAPAWADVLATLEIVLDGVDSVHASVSLSDTELRLQVALKPRPGGVLETFLGAATPSDPKALLGRVAGQALHQWVWLDLRHAPLELDALTAATASLTVFEPALTEAVATSDLAVARALDGPVLRVHIGFPPDRHQILVAPAKDEAAYRAAVAARAATVAKLDGASKADSPLLPSAEGTPPPPQVLSTLSLPGDDDASQLVDAWGDGLAISVLGAKSADFFAPPSAEAKAPWSDVLDGFEGKPIALGVIDLAASQEEASPPLVGGVFITPEALQGHLVVPVKQQGRLLH